MNPYIQTYGEEYASEISFKEKLSEMSAEKFMAITFYQTYRKEYVSEIWRRALSAEKFIAIIF